ncbi:MAG: ribonucleotide-diphosphate reductase subunit beta, partial [Saprospiraceae bacterium]
MRTSFKTVAKGLDFDSFPMKLWAKAKKYGIWDPAAIDFTQDKKDWDNLNHSEQLFIARVVTQFQAGEEAVTLDLLPLIMAVAKEGRIEEEMYLTSFLWEEA